MASRAVHLEVACSLEANSFLQAFFRFIHRRGGVSEIFSDNGTNFAMAERELRVRIKRWNQQLIHKSLSQKGIKWHFNPPHSPSSGGAWEILVKLVKKILRSLERKNSHWRIALHFPRWSGVDNEHSPVNACERFSRRFFGLNTNVAAVWQLGFVVASRCVFPCCRIPPFLESGTIFSRLILAAMDERILAASATSTKVITTSAQHQGWWPRDCLRWKFEARRVAKTIVEETCPDGDGTVRRVPTASTEYLRDVRKLCRLEARDWATDSRFGRWRRCCLLWFCRDPFTLDCLN